jgi:hypothetical protein
VFDRRNEDMRVLAVDPGSTTGYVLWEGDEGYVGGLDVHLGVLRRGEFKGGWKAGASGVFTACRAWNADVLVLEDFILEGGDHSSEREGLDSCRINAVVEFNLNRDGPDLDDGGVVGRLGVVIPIVYQTASQAKGIITDERLRKWGLWHRGSAHVRDAHRHLCLYLRTLK